MENIHLIELFQKQFPEKLNGKETGVMITYYEIHLSDREESKVFRLKPYINGEFEPVYLKAKKFIGSKVKLVIKTKYDKGIPIPCIVDIAEDKTK